MTSSRQRAVVLGGGAAGVRAARVVADGFADVTLIERELRPVDPCDLTRRGPTGPAANVTIMDGYDVVGLRPSADRHRVIGVRVSSRCGHGSQVLPADLVIGCGSPADGWLADVDLDADGGAFDLETLAGILSDSPLTDRADYLRAAAAIPSGFIVLAGSQ